MAWSLPDALGVWRATRDPWFADAIEYLPSRRLVPGSPLHAWWIAQAEHYDPDVAGVLLEYLPVRIRASEPRWSDVRARWRDSPLIAIVGDDARGSSTTWLDRAAALVQWPDDPRVARVLATWLTSPWSFVSSELRAPVAALIADRLAAIGDLRVVRRLAAYVQHAGDTIERPAVQRALAALSEITPVLAEPTIDLVPTELDVLWQRAAAAPDARPILGDALSALGDERGTFIALASAGTAKTERQARKLVDVFWDRWAGPDLAVVAVRDSLVFERGLLAELRVGHHFTPPWAWQTAAHHRELASVHTVRPASIIDHASHAEFLARLPRLRTLEIDHHATLDACAQPLPIRRLEIRRAKPRDEPFDLLRAIDRAREVAPALAEIAIRARLPDADEAASRHGALVHLLPDVE